MYLGVPKKMNTFMNCHLPLSFIFFLLSIAFIFRSFQRWKRIKDTKKHKKFPPSPPKLPFLGHLHHFVGALPHRSLANLAKKYGPFLHLQLGEVSLVAISSPEIAREVLKTHDPACAGRPRSLGATIIFYNYKDIAFSDYNNYWRYMRKVCITEMLSPKNVRSFSSIRKDEASSLVKLIQSSSGKLINLTEKLCSFSSLITCRAAFGDILKDRETMIKFFKEGLAVAGGFDLADLFPSLKWLQLVSWKRYKLLRMRDELDVILDGIIQEHKDKLAATGKGNGELGGEDIVDVLLRIKESKELEFPVSYENIKAIIFDLFTAGTETSSTMIDWAMAELMRNPRVMSKLQAEIRQALNGKRTFDEDDYQKLKYLKMVIKETFRLHQALLPRACREECEVQGYSIPVKANVAINVWAMGRDPNYWQDPETFYPERFENNDIDFLGNNFEFLPFGAGKRICPGINFGLANIELAMAQLLYHFNWNLPEGISCNDVDMTEAQGLSVTRKNALMVIPTPCTPPIDGLSF